MPKKSDVISSPHDVLSQIPRMSPTQDVFGWSVPVEQVPLPSNGVIYSPSSPLHGRETLQIKAMTAQEEDILLSRALIKEGTVATHLIKSCLIDKMIDVNDLLAGDRNSLLVAIRITGYGTAYTASATCPSCNRDDTHTFDLSNIGIKRLSVDPISQGMNEFSFDLPVSKKKVTFKLITVRDEDEISRTKERMSKLFPDAKIDNVVTRQLENQILSIDGIYEKGPINAFIKSMPALDSRMLRTHMANIEPGLDMRVDLSCKFCGAESKVALPAGASFFWSST
jgi:hypothetical protein